MPQFFATKYYQSLQDRYVPINRLFVCTPGGDYHKPLASSSRPRWRGWRAGAGGMCARMFCARLGAHTAGQRGGRRIPRCAQRRLEPSSARNLVKGAHRWRAPREAMPDAAASQAANAAHRRAPCKSPESGSPVPSEPGSGDLHGNTREQENGGIFAAVLLFAGYFVSAHTAGWPARTTADCLAWFSGGCSSAAGGTTVAQPHCPVAGADHWCVCVCCV